LDVAGLQRRGVSTRPGSRPPVPEAPVDRLHFSRDYARQIVAAKAHHSEWERVRRGAYVDAGRLTTPRAKALAAIAAVDERIEAPHWFSHESAALVWGLPVWRVPSVTHVRQDGRPGGERDRAIQRHRGPLDGAHVATVSGLPVTDIEQTMVDCARTGSPIAGLVVADAALRAGADRAAALELLAPMRGRNGCARAREVITLADDGAESPGETATRFVLLRDGLPRPATQVRVMTRLGAFWADVGWDEWGLLLEYDGRAKYLTGDALIREKRRQDALLETNKRLIRVTREDIPRAAGLSARVRRLLPPDVATIRRPLLQD
jgi:hypothetical protein